MIPFYCFNNMAIGIVLCCYLYGGHFFQHFTRAYENLALGKSAWQLNPLNSDDNYSANRAVDGRKSDLSAFDGECTSSSYYKTTAMWWVDLGTLQNIHHIFIQYATGNRVWDEENYQSSFFLGFSVYVSPTPNKDDGVLCFRDTNYTRATIPNPVNITCPHPGRYVIYYNNRTHKPYPDEYSETAYNDLCEVEVYGCHNLGHYGTSCSIPCPQNCLFDHCHIANGVCVGCIAGYKGKSCNEECNNNMYGLECSQTCGNCSKGEQCHHVNGSCINGCDVGVFGDKCDKECPPRFYGNNCQNKCSVNCGVRERCDRKSGKCDRGCKKGWIKPNCVTKCRSGTFGQDCTESCGKCFANEPCHYVNGTCMNGCERGYQGMQCKKGPDDDREDNSPLKAGVLVAVLVVVAVIVFVVVFGRKRLKKQQISQNEIDRQDPREKVAYRRSGNLNNADISNVSESLASVDDERILMPKPAHVAARRAIPLRSWESPRKSTKEQI